MKKCIVSIIGLVTLWLSSAIRADETNSAWLPETVTFWSVVADKYVAFCLGVELYNKPVIQSDLKASWACGLYVDLWNSSPLNGNWNDNFGSEVDYSVGWAGKLSKLGLTGPISELSLDIGTAYFDEPGVFSLGADDLLYSHIKLFKDTKWATFMVAYENYIAMPGSSYGKPTGNLLSVGVSKDTSLFNGLLNPRTFFIVSYDTGCLGLDSGVLLRGGAELDWRLSKHLSLVCPQVNYFAPINMNDSRRLTAVVYAGFSYKF